MKAVRKTILLVVSLVGFFMLPGYVWLKASQQKADLIIFSYDRPLQLYALLESTKKYITGLGKTVVIYRSSNQEFHDAYDKVRTTFAWAEFWEQGAHPQFDFKPLTMKALNALSSMYVLFAVDDIVVKDYVDLADCVKALVTSGAYSFYLRLGSCLTDCYTCSAPQPLPRSLTSLGSDLLTWTLGGAPYDWGYPNTVDMAIYRKADVIKDFSSFSFTNPNTLEGNWACLGNRVAKRKGLCFIETKMVNLPLNRVQNTYCNRNMESFTPQELLVSFNQGLKMDIEPLFKIKNPGVHMEYVPTFVTL